MSDTRAEIEITASSSRLQAGLRTAASKLTSFMKGVNASAGRIGDTAAGTAIGNIAGNLAGRGIDLLADQARGVMDFEKNLVRLQIVSNKTKGEMNEFRDSARAISNEVGIGATDIIKGAQTYVDLTGNVTGAKNAMASFARIAQASDSSVSDIATSAAAMQQSFGLDPSKIEETFSGLINQGKAGAVSLKDMAGQLASLAPKWDMFKGGRSAQGIHEFGAIFQVVRQGSGSAAEAATNLEALLGTMTKHAKELRKYGHIKLFDVAKDGTKTPKAFEEILTQIENSKLMKDPELLVKALGGRKESSDALRVIMRARQEVTATGNAYTDLVHAGEDAGAVQRDLATYLDSSSGKMEASWERVKNALAAAITPERIEAFANAVSDAADKITPLVESVGKIGSVLGGLWGAGKSIRSAFSSNQNNNPWAESNAKDFRMSDTGGRGGFVDQLLLGRAGGPNGPIEARSRAMLARNRLASHDSYDATVANIMGGEVNERTSPESIQRAVFAHFANPGAMGGPGTQAAGNAYLRAANVSDEKAAEILAKAIADQLTAPLKSLGPMLKDAVASLKTEVKVGSDTVAKASGKAPMHARGT